MKDKKAALFVVSPCHMDYAIVFKDKFCAFYYILRHPFMHFSTIRKQRTKLFDVRFMRPS